MHRISSQWTFVNKTVSPALFLVVIAVIALKAWSQVKAGVSNAGMLIIPVGIAVFGFVMMRKYAGGLMDEVWDAGTTLLIKNDGDEDRVALADIINISYTTFQNPNRVTLTLRQPCRFGSEISFIPPARFMPFARNPIIDDLISRVDQARRAYQ